MLKYIICLLMYVEFILLKITERNTQGGVSNSHKKSRQAWCWQVWQH